MNNQDYEKARQECWDALRKELLKDEVQWEPVSRKEIFNFAFDRAYALGKQEKDAKEKKNALTDKEEYALESAISELESLMDGTLDEDYHKEQKTIIKALKRIIKKYEKK